MSWLWVDCELTVSWLWSDRQKSDAARWFPLKNVQNNRISYDFHELIVSWQWVALWIDAKAQVKTRMKLQLFSIKKHMNQIQNMRTPLSPSFPVPILSGLPTCLVTMQNSYRTPSNPQFQCWGVFGETQRGRKSNGTGRPKPSTFPMLGRRRRKHNVVASRGAP